MLKGDKLNDKDVYGCRNPEEKCKVYQEYIGTVKELSQEEKYAECDINGILKVKFTIKYNTYNKIKQITK